MQFSIAPDRAATLARTGALVMPILEDSLEVELAFQILSGEYPLPPNTDRMALLKHHRAVLRVAMDRAWAKSAAQNPFRPDLTPPDNYHSDRGPNKPHKV